MLLCSRTCGRREPDRQGKKNSATRSRGPRPARRQRRARCQAASPWGPSGSTPRRRRRQARRPRGAGAGCGSAPPRADQSGSDGRSSRPSPASTSRSCATAERTPSAAGGHMSAAGCTCRCSSPTPIRRWRACSGTPADHRAETVRFRPPRRHKRRTLLAKDTDGNNLAASQACQAAKERLRLREVGKSISITVLSAVSEGWRGGIPEE